MTGTENGLAGDIGTQIDMLNNGDPGTGNGPPPRCTWTDAEGEEHNNGTPQWVLTRLGDDSWTDVRGGNPDEGTYYRYECWHDDMLGEDCETEDGETRCFGEPIYGVGCSDDFVCYFPDINPENIARWIVDSYVRGLPAPDPQFSPPGGTTLVNFDTWMWVENIPEDPANPPVLGVPGITVRTEVHGITELRWDMGDSNPAKDCPLVTSEEEAADICTYPYQRSSAGEPNDKFAGSVDLTWTATWTVEEFPALTGEVEVPMTTPFTLGVAESQAIITD